LLSPFSNLILFISAPGAFSFSFCSLAARCLNELLPRSRYLHFFSPFFSSPSLRSFLHELTFLSPCFLSFSRGTSGGQTDSFFSPFYSEAPSVEFFSFSTSDFAVLPTHSLFAVSPYSLFSLFPFSFPPLPTTLRAVPFFSSVPSQVVSVRNTVFRSMLPPPAWTFAVLFFFPPRFNLFSPPAGLTAGTHVSHRSLFFPKPPGRGNVPSPFISTFFSFPLFPPFFFFPCRRVFI